MSHDDFNFEPIKGLPEKLPEDEHILWQGAPDPRRLAREALGIRWAKLDAKPSGHGTLAFELIGETRLSYLMTWPHVRPWYMARTQPALRCIKDAAEVAAIFADAAETRINQPQVARTQTQDSGNAVAAE